MNKATKGAVAAGAAALLLAGGAGTMAAWNASAPMTGGTITAGHLTLTAVGSAPTWTVSNANTDAGAAKAITDIGTFRTVPGDTITYTGQVKVGIEGKNLKAKVVADTSTISGSLASAMTITPTTTISAGAVTELTEANNDATVTVAVTFDFPKGAIVAPDNAANNATQNQTAGLAGFNVKLEQI
ncbi:alternate-type signal peptide domain-containing protein [Rhodococcus sp. OK302]|uniref:alternate-type signal peptide domain-containing protein n=1 Tax=Rhodococcus sp. OK302 TaxID=1882769 RepID=UPI000B9F53E6|nr:alternate-type signal peptide domain-containing protein [Rhodococcus sp. OK302]OYD66709.1 alternate signal-mediated exported protein [Rhodococcus sp. OK302]